MKRLAWYCRIFPNLRSLAQHRNGNPNHHVRVQCDFQRRVTDRFDRPGRHANRRLGDIEALLLERFRNIAVGDGTEELAALADRNPPPAIGGKRFRIYYATQTSTRPFRIKLFCNREEKLTESYRRYLEAGVIEEFKLEGCPVYFDLVGKARRYELGEGPVSGGKKGDAAPTPRWKAQEAKEDFSPRTHETLED